MTSASRSDVTSTSSELRRIDFTGTIWFAATVVGSGIPMAALLVSGWRPHELPAFAAIVWWIGGALVVLAAAAFAWAGCPVLDTDVTTADRRKSLCIRAGVVLLLAGGVAASLAVLLAPAP